MEDLTDVYNDLIMEHSMNSYNKKKLDHCDLCSKGHNPNCGDEITLELKLNGDKIEDMAFSGHGCAISQASTSIMIDTLRGKTIEEAKEIEVILSTLSAQADLHRDEIRYDLENMVELDFIFARAALAMEQNANEPIFNTEGKIHLRKARHPLINAKKVVVEEITGKFNDSQSAVVVEYRGLSVAEVTELRRKLRESGSDYKVYKNTLTRRAVEESKLGLEDYLTGPNAISFGTDELSIVKVLSDFSKDHKALELKAGIIDGKVANAEELAKYASIPSREGLLTMLAGGLIGTVKDLSIALNLLAEQKEN